MLSAMVRNFWSRYRGPLFQALREVVVTAVIVLTPVWGGAALSLLLGEIPTFVDALSANTARGDLFLLALAAIAPLTLYMSVNRRELPAPLTLQFPLGRLFQIFLLLLFGSCTFLFSIKRAAEFPGSSFKVNDSLFLAVSIGTYIFSVMLSLIMTTIKFDLEALNIEEYWRMDTDALVAEFQESDRS